MGFTFLIVIASMLAIANLEPATYKREWNKFKEDFNKVYKDQNEEALKYKTFISNMEKIEKHNAQYHLGKSNFSLGINQFGDFTEAEYFNYAGVQVDVQLGKRERRAALYKRSIDHSSNEIGEDIPNSIDYREKGAVNPIKDQKLCGSCWAFGAIATIESLYYKISGKLLRLSEQNLVDCSTYNSGCDGGAKEYAFMYIQDNGIEEEDAYPYTAKDGTCHHNKSKSALYLEGYDMIPEGEDNLKKAIATIGPVSATVDASRWQFYKSGVFSTNEEKLNMGHEIGVVGYATTHDGEDYWIVRNSFGEKWGEGGYMRLARNKNNQCHIASNAAYPILK